MSQPNEKTTKVGKRAGYDSIGLAAVGSVLLAGYQHYIRGNKEHELSIGLWPLALLGLSNTIHIEEISKKNGDSTENLPDQLTQGR